jgi:hypothetical protein
MYVFPLAIFFIGAAVLVGLPLTSTLQTYFKNRGRRPVTCPDDHKAAEVEIDRKFALQAAIHGKEQMRVQSCTHWPENGQCGQECLIQVEATPENIDRLLTKWFDGKPCSVCARPLAPSDWRHGRMGFLNDQLRLVELRQVDFEAVGSMAAPTHPLCWKCHQEEKQRRASPIQIAGHQRARA